MRPVAYVAIVGGRATWDPLSRTGPTEKKPRPTGPGIARYIEQNPDYLLDLILVYADTDDAYFEVEPAARR